MPARKPLQPGEAGAFLKVDNLQQLQEDLALLAEREVLVGFPEETADRKDGDELNNAARGYIHDNGAPEQNIPARPFMLPGIESAEAAITRALATTAMSVLKNTQRTAPKTNIVERGLHAVGLIAQSAIKAKIAEGIPPPLADATLAARARRVPSRTAEKQELANRRKGMSPSTDLVKPLIDTGEMQGAVKYALRSKKERKDA